MHPEVEGSFLDMVKQNFFFFCIKMLQLSACGPELNAGTSLQRYPADSCVKQTGRCLANHVVNERMHTNLREVIVSQLVERWIQIERSILCRCRHFLLFVESTTTTTDHRYHYYYVSARAGDSELISLVHCS